MDKIRSENAVALALIAVVCAAVMYRQLVTYAVFSAVYDDTVVYLNWTRQFVESLREGVFYPRWMPDSYGGYGSPTFVFYQPLVTYITALTAIATGNTISAVALVKLAGLFLSGVFMYIYIKDLWGHRAGLAAAAVYMALPYRVFDLYLLGVHSSRFAFVWFPLVLYFTRRAVIEARPGKYTVLLATSYALLCITHLFSAYMFTPVLIGFGLLYAGRGRYVRTSVRLAAAISLGLMLDGFYLLPILFERRLVHFELMQNSWWSDYRNNFLFDLFPGPGRLSPLYQGLAPFRLYMARTIISSTLVGVPLYLYLMKSKEQRRDLAPVFFLIVTTMSLVMMTSLSSPLWEALPGMKLLSFPTRWASVTVLGISCIAGAGAYHMRSGGYNTLTGIGLGVLLAAVTAAALFYDIDIIRQNHTLTTSDIAGSPTDLDLKEYLPRAVPLGWLAGGPDNRPSGKVVPLDGNAIDIKMERWGAAERSFVAQSASPAVLRIRTFYYPGWRALVDGMPAVLSAEAASGAILMDVPPGTHRVELRFTDTPDRVWGKVLSALAAASALLLLGISRTKGGAQLS